jgi:hypothetical protein
MSAALRLYEQLTAASLVGWTSEAPSTQEVIAMLLQNHRSRGR